MTTSVPDNLPGEPIVPPLVENIIDNLAQPSALRQLVDSDPAGRGWRQAAVSVEVPLSDATIENLRGLFTPTEQVISITERPSLTVHLSRRAYGLRRWKWGAHWKVDLDGCGLLGASSGRALTQRGARRRIARERRRYEAAKNGRPTLAAQVEHARLMLLLFAFAVYTELVREWYGMRNAIERVGRRARKRIRQWVCSRRGHKWSEWEPLPVFTALEGRKCTRCRSVGETRFGPKLRAQFEAFNKQMRKASAAMHAFGEAVKTAQREARRRKPLDTGTLR